MRDNRRTDVLSLASFVALGLPDGMIGTAWPSMRHTLGLPVGDLGLLLLASTAGAVAITVVVGSLIRRRGVASLLAAAFAVSSGAFVGFALAPPLGAILVVSALLGVAAGMIDGGLNTAVGLSGRGRLLNLLHGAYGVGTAIGPLVVTVAVLLGSWRPAYLVLLAADLGLGAAWLRIGRRGPTAPRSQEQAPPVASNGPVRSMRAAILAGIVVFFVYTGLEVSAGQWETTFSRGHLHLSTSTAGLATFGYWGALTAARISLALLPRPVSNQTVVRWSSVVAVLAAGAVWWQPDTAITVGGFVVLAAALGGVFPALIALTPLRLGDDRAKRVIAWQVGAAAAGGAAVSAFVGLLIGISGLSVLGPALVIMALALIAAELVLSRLAPAAGP